MARRYQDHFDIVGFYDLKRLQQDIERYEYEEWIRNCIGAEELEALGDLEKEDHSKR